MKLIRHGNPGTEKPGIQIGETRYDVSAQFADYNETFFENNGLESLRNLAADPSRLPELPEGIRLGCPVARPGKIVCVGLNYADHAREINIKIPTEPIIFLKATSALAGINDTILIPRDALKTDWEVELAVVIGKRTSYVEEADALHHVAGYCLHNDYSERAFQLERGGEWTKGKSADTFAPMGPFLVTPDEIPDTNHLHLWLSVNGIMRQHSHTSEMIFKVPFLIAYISRFMTLLPGDIISTGTPHGSGMGLNPPLFLKAGDVVELGIEGLGTGKQNLQ